MEEKLSIFNMHSKITLFNLSSNKANEKEILSFQI
jgi:hypothetical protein